MSSFSKLDIFPFVVYLSLIALFTCFPESTKEKNKDLEQKVDMSKNAQFRAIQPSSSILSFVEDNVIYMRVTSK